MLCAHCGGEFIVHPMAPHQKFCSRKCRDAYRREHEADGVVLKCEHCGKEFTPRRITGRRTNRFCSRACWFAYSARDRRLEAVQLLIVRLQRIKVCRICGRKSFTSECSRECRLQLGRIKAFERSKARCEKNTFRCYQCGSQFRPEYGDKHSKFCSRECADRFQSRIRKRKVRSRKWKTQYEFDRFSDLEIFDRDGWRCMLCGKLVAREIGGPQPTAPTIDHIVPLSRGGSHTRGNVQCAHRMCNSIKSDKPMADALQLIAKAGDTRGGSPTCRTMPKTGRAGMREKSHMENPEILVDRR